MRRRHIPTLAALMLLSCAAAPPRAQGAPPAGVSQGAPMLRSAGALLRYKFAVGQMIRYRTVADLEITILDAAQHRTIPLTQHIETVTRQTVESVDASKDAATIAIQIDSMRISVNGQSLPESDAQREQMAAISTLVLTSTGKALSVKVNAPASDTGFDIGELIVTQQNGILPTRAINVGDSWSSAIDIGAVGARVATTLRLVNLTTSAGGVIARIAQSAAGVVNSGKATGLPAGFKMSGKVTMSGQLQFDVNAGSLKSQSTTSHFNATVDSPANAQDKRMGASQVRFNLTQRTTRLDGDDPATAAPNAL